MEQLTRIALVGTSRTRIQARDFSSPATAMIEALVSGGEIPLEPEDHLLLLAGTDSVCQLAGFTGMGLIPAMQPAPEETCQAGSRQLSGLLQNAFATRETELLIEFLTQLRGSRTLIPFDVLPVALDASDLTIREALLPVIGERGRWLAGLNPQWSWVREGVAALSEQNLNSLKLDFEVGNFALRVRSLGTIRRSDPAMALDWLRSVFSSEKPDHRVRLLSTLQHGLAARDEEFLRECLSDRSSAVKTAAAELMWQLPGSEISQRMQSRAEAMLCAAGEGSPGTLRLICNPPEQLEKSWVADGIPSTPPEGRGKRAFWATCLLSAVSPDFWTQRFPASPRELIEAIIADTFSDAVAVGWSEAAVRFCRQGESVTQWMPALCEHWVSLASRMEGSGRDKALNQLKLLLPAMDSPAAESVVETMLKSSQESLITDLTSLLSPLKRPWSAGFARNYLATARQMLSRPSSNQNYQWATSLFLAARSIPADCFPEALAEWKLPERAGGWHQDAVSRELEKFNDTIQVRKQFSDSITKNANSP